MLLLLLAAGSFVLARTCRRLRSIGDRRLIRIDEAGAEFSDSDETPPRGGEIPANRAMTSA